MSIADIYSSKGQTSRNCALKFGVGKKKKSGQHRNYVTSTQLVHDVDIPAGYNDAEGQEQDIDGKRKLQPHKDIRIQAIIETCCDTNI